MSVPVIPDNVEELSLEELEALSGAASLRLHELRARDHGSLSAAEAIRIEMEVGQCKAISRVVDPLRTAKERAANISKSARMRALSKLSDEEWDAFRQEIKTINFDATEIPEEF